MGLGETEPNKAPVTNTSEILSSNQVNLNAKEISAADWNQMSEEEKKAVQIMSQTEISPERVTSQVLKICNVIRQRLDVKGQ